MCPLFRDDEQQKSGTISLAIGLYFPRPILAHCQLYVSVPRIRRKKGLEMVIRDEYGKLTNITTNMV